MIPIRKNMPVKNAERYRKSLLLLCVSFQRIPRADGKKKKARVKAPAINKTDAPGQCMILKMEAKPNISVPTIPEIFIVFFIFLYLVSTA